MRISDWSSDVCSSDLSIASPNVLGGDLRTPDVDGERIRLVGRVLDGDGEPAGDAMIEIWQADPQGRYAHPADTRGANMAFRGFGRCGTGTDPEKRFVFDTLKPEIGRAHVGTPVTNANLVCR